LHRKGIRVFRGMVRVRHFAASTRAQEVGDAHFFWTAGSGSATVPMVAPIRHLGTCGKVGVMKYAYAPLAST
jgi:hypothetical protein